MNLMISRSMFTILASVLLCVSLAANAQVDPDDLQAVRTWMGDPGYQIELIWTVDDPAELTDEFGLAASIYREYRSEDRSTGFRISTLTHEVVQYIHFINPKVYMGRSNVNYRQLAWTYLQNHLPPSKLATLQATNVPDVFAPKLPTGMIDWHNRVEIPLDVSGVPGSMEIHNATAPLYTGQINIGLTQAKQIATSYMLNIAPPQSTVTFSAMLLTENLITIPDSIGYWQPVWQLLMEAGNSEDSIGCYVYVNAVDGSAFDDLDQWLGGTSAFKPKFGRGVGVRVLYNGLPVRTGKSSDVPIGWLNTLAKGHKLTAKAGEKAFTMDGKRIALPAKVVAKAGTMYLPWQAMKSVPGVKCSYDAKLNKLDITTSPAVKKAK